MQYTNQFALQNYKVMFPLPFANSFTSWARKKNRYLMEQSVKFAQSVHSSKNFVCSSEEQVYINSQHYTGQEEEEKGGN